MSSDKTCCMCATPIGKKSIRCKPCLKKYRRENKIAKKEYLREWTLNSKYGISTKEFDNMFNQIQGRCEICNIEMQKPISKQGGQPKNTAFIDHDHDTKKIRGLLCNSCNRLLGTFEKSAKNQHFFSLEKAMKYLNK